MFWTNIADWLTILWLGISLGFFFQKLGDFFQFSSHTEPDLDFKHTGH